ncbi:MAG: hypothetical protein ACE5FT_07615 [Candidatus Nanoarchaeia archaeon]
MMARGIDLDAFGDLFGEPEKPKEPELELVSPSTDSDYGTASDFGLDSEVDVFGETEEVGFVPDCDEVNMHQMEMSQVPPLAVPEIKSEDPKFLQMKEKYGGSLVHEFPGNEPERPPEVESPIGKYLKNAVEDIFGDADGSGIVDAFPSQKLPEVPEEVDTIEAMAKDLYALRDMQRDVMRDVRDIRRETGRYGARMDALSVEVEAFGKLVVANKPKGNSLYSMAAGALIGAACALGVVAIGYPVLVSTMEETSLNAADKVARANRAQVYELKKLIKDLPEEYRDTYDSMVNKVSAAAENLENIDEDLRSDNDLRTRQLIRLDNSLTNYTGIMMSLNESTTENSVRQEKALELLDVLMVDIARDYTN